MPEKLQVFPSARGLFPWREVPFLLREIPFPQPRSYGFALNLHKNAPRGRRAQVFYFSFWCTSPDVPENSPDTGGKLPKYGAAKRLCNAHEAKWRKTRPSASSPPPLSGKSKNPRTDTMPVRGFVFSIRNGIRYH